MLYENASKPTTKCSVSISRKAISSQVTYTVKFVSVTKFGISNLWSSLVIVIGYSPTTEIKKGGFITS